MFSNMKPAEKRLLEACKKGELLILSDNRPFQKTDDNEIRGEFLRTLILSNNQEIEVESEKFYLKWKLNFRKRILKIDPKGIMFSGAYISGEFNFSFCNTDLPLLFTNSVFKKEINLSDSKIKLLNLNGSQVDGINAQGLFCHSQIFISNVKSTREINLISAQIDGSLICSNSKFTRVLDESYEGKSYFVKDGKLKNKEMITLNLNSAKINGNVLFDKKFISKGEVSLISAEIDGGVICSDAKFINKNRNALSFNSAKINGNVFLGKNFFVSGALDFSASKVEKISISKEIRIKGYCLFSSMRVDTINMNNINFDEKHLKKLVLDGLTYNHLSGKKLDSKTLLQWLEKMPEFKPQPYKQLAKILRNMGHNEDADNIMIKYSDNIRKKNCRLSISIFKWIYGFTSSYGYKPMRIVYFMLSIWFIFGLFFLQASKVAVFAPTNPLIFQKKDFYECYVSGLGTPIEDFINSKNYDKTNNWVLNKNLEGEYTTFQPFLYSLDNLLPILELQMDKDWGVYIPSSSENTTLNHITRVVVWLEILLGWYFSLILVAILSGLAKNEKD